MDAADQQREIDAAVAAAVSAGVTAQQRVIDDLTQLLEDTRSALANTRQRVQDQRDAIEVANLSHCGSSSSSSGTTAAGSTPCTIHLRTSSSHWTKYCR
jgi:hypothetical protein